MLVNEFMIHPPVWHQDLEHPVKERQISARRDREPIIRYVRPKKGAADGRWNPVPLHARFAIRVYQYDFGPQLLRLDQVLHGNRLGISRIGPEENYQVRA